MQNKSESDPKATSDAENAKNAMKKKTAQELAEMATVNRAFSAESADEMPPLAQKQSESSLAPLSSQLKSLPLVKAFNSAENQKEKQNKK